MDPLPGGSEEVRTVSDLTGNTDYQAVLTCWDERNQSVLLPPYHFEPMMVIAASVTDLLLTTGQIQASSSCLGQHLATTGSMGQRSVMRFVINQTGPLQSKTLTQLLWTNTITLHLEAVQNLIPFTRS